MQKKVKICDIVTFTEFSEERLKLPPDLSGNAGRGRRLIKALDRTGDIIREQDMRKRAIYEKSFELPANRKFIIQKRAPEAVCFRGPRVKIPLVFTGFRRSEVLRNLSQPTLR